MPAMSGINSLNYEVSYGTIALNKTNSWNVVNNNILEYNQLEFLNIEYVLPVSNPIFIPSYVRWPVITTMVVFTLV